MPQFSHPEATLFHEETGRGEPLLCLHGLGASSYTWRHLAPKLATSRRVITLDLKGFGQSEKPKDGRYTAWDQARLVVAFIDALQLTGLTLVGHSYGGTVALLSFLELQARTLSPIKRLILISAAAYPQPLPLGFRLLKLPLLNRISTALIPARYITKLVLKECYYRPELIPDESIDAYAQLLGLPGARHAILRTVLSLPPRDVDAIIERYPSIDIPTLLIWGAHDRIVPPGVGQLLHTAIPASRLHLIDEAGHMPQEECSQRTARIMEDFLRDTSSQPQEN